MMTASNELQTQLRAKADEIDRDVSRTQKDILDGVWNEIELMRQAADELDAKEERHMAMVARLSIAAKQLDQQEATIDTLREAGTGRRSDRY